MKYKLLLVIALGVFSFLSISNCYIIKYINVKGENSFLFHKEKKKKKIYVKNGWHNSSKNDCRKEKKPSQILNSFISNQNSDDETEKSKEIKNNIFNINPNYNEYDRNTDEENEESKLSSISELKKNSQTIINEKEDDTETCKKNDIKQWKDDYKINDSISNESDNNYLNKINENKNIHVNNHFSCNKTSHDATEDGITKSENSYGIKCKNNIEKYDKDNSIEYISGTDLVKKYDIDDQGQEHINSESEKKEMGKNKKYNDLKIIRNLPLVSIIGRPNVGKSTIFNRLTRKFQEGSIVLDKPSTRDKFYGKSEWDGYRFEVVDTGGLIFEDENFSKEIRDQILLALEESSVVLFVVDGINGVHPIDLEICRFLRKFIKKKYNKIISKQSKNGEYDNESKRELLKCAQKKTYCNNIDSNNENVVDNTFQNCLSDSSSETDCSKSSVNTELNISQNEEYISNDINKTEEENPKQNEILKVIVCVNKCESYKDGYIKAQNFWELGFETPFPCSGIHGNGLSEILDECIKYIKKVKINELEEEEDEKNTINISFIGKPNTGKSSILNKILNCNRFIVSPIAGTTIDSIDVLVKGKNDKRMYRLIDTAGIQKRKKNVPFNEKTKFEYLLFNRTEKAIKRSDVCVLVIDSFNGISSHDINIARKILEENKSCIICCNKWDLIYNKNDIFNDTKNYVLNLLKPIDFSDVLFISAKTSQRLSNIFQHAEEAYKNYTRRLNTNTLNQIIKEALLLRPPVPIKGKTLNIYYAIQAHIKPPGFVFFCNSEKSTYLNYTKYLESRIREAFNIRATPIKIYYKQKKKRRLMKKFKDPDKYNLDIQDIQKKFLETQAQKNAINDSKKKV
ncbi:ribosome-associated GTPase EngA [Plasmodium yoelii 17X]|uniref:GTPase Der n=1 Tax=Plasmodium yoelii 17X TaxID=1323249 RepID=V7PU33_PLAYE|nr:ribosome-associated GTPase EngA [Plasmodium yoelii 17X]